MIEQNINVVRIDDMDFGPLACLDKAVAELLHPEMAVWTEEIFKDGTLEPSGADTSRIRMSTNTGGKKNRLASTASTASISSGV